MKQVKITVKLPIYNQAGEKTLEMDVNPKIFGLKKPDSGLIHQSVRVQLANARAPIAHTKRRGEVSGGGKKPWRQKGTGRARAGSIRSPLWRGGGVVFGPRSTRNFSLKMNRTAFRQALFTVLSDKARSNKLVILEQLPKMAKTKEFIKAFGGLTDKLGFKKYVLVLAQHNHELERSAQNLPNAKVLIANSLNVVDLLKYDPLILKDALLVIEKTYLK